MGHTTLLFLTSVPCVDVAFPCYLPENKFHATECFAVPSSQYRVSKRATQNYIFLCRPLKHRVDFIKKDVSCRIFHVPNFCLRQSRRRTPDFARSLGSRMQ